MAIWIMWATPISRTESYIALKVHVGNWRWAGVPFYLRTGKRLRARESEIAVVFRDPAAHYLSQCGAFARQCVGDPPATG